jgi:hypothetical protein
VDEGRLPTNEQLSCPGTGLLDAGLGLSCGIRLQKPERNQPRSLMRKGRTKRAIAALRAREIRPAFPPGQANTASTGVFAQGVRASS